jgi:hypothetical protein
MHRLPNDFAPRKGESVEVLRLAPEDACPDDMLALIRWQDRNVAVPLFQLTATNTDESTRQAIQQVPADPGQNR